MPPLRRCAVLAAVLAGACPEAARANVPGDDPLHDEVARRRVVDEELSPLVSFGALGEGHLLRLLKRPSSRPDGFFARPVRRATLRALLYADEARPYSTPALVRELAGSVAVSCEHTEGRPCGNGLSLVADVDLTAGYGDWLDVVVRPRVFAGTDAVEPDAELDRAYASVTTRWVTGQVGRDVIVVGPSRFTQLTWGRHAPPVDHARVTTTEPLVLARGRSPVLELSILGAVTRLRPPQDHEGTLVSLARLQFDLLRRFSVGGTQMLQLGGDGAPELDFFDFVLEHFRRVDRGPAQGLSNRRVSFDFQLFVPAWSGARLYYEVVFEDFRNKMDDAITADADHLLGAEWAALGPGARHGLVVEVGKTGVRSQEHRVWATGMTNAGRTVGSPLGPDALWAFAAARLDVRGTVVEPWIQVATMTSDPWAETRAPGETLVGIGRVGDGPDETRWRAGVGVERDLSPEIRASGRAVIEVVDTFFFEPGRTRANGGAELVLTWSPDWTVP